MQYVLDRFAAEIRAALAAIPVSKSFSALYEPKAVVTPACYGAPCRSTGRVSLFAGRSGPPVAPGFHSYCTPPPRFSQLVFCTKTASSCEPCFTAS